MRARKFTFGYGTLKFFMLTWKMDYVRVDSFTRYGVFGIQLWTQLKMVRRAPDELTSLQREASAAQSVEQKEQLKKLQESRRLKQYKNKKKRRFQKEHPITKPNMNLGICN
jgi:ribosomal protein S3